MKANSKKGYAKKGSRYKTITINKYENDRLITTTRVVKIK